MPLIVIILTLLSLVSCTNPPYRGADVMGADEFVMESYKIREGKFAILELQGKDYEELAPELLEPYDDTIQDGDVLSILLFHPSRKDLGDMVSRLNDLTGFPVKDGKIRLPDFGNVEVEGLNLEEAAEKIQKLYRNEVSDVDVFVKYKSREIRKVMITGYAGSGIVPVDGRLTLYELMISRGMRPDSNYFNSYFLRDGAYVPVDFHRLIKDGDMTQNIVLRGGDIIYIADAAASTIMALGEVGKPGLISVPNGYIPLTYAIGAAGGIKETGDKAYIQIVRGNVANPKIFTLNWQHVARLPTDSLLLIPGDILYVAATPLSELQRLMDQIMPAIANVQLARARVRNLGINVP